MSLQSVLARHKRGLRAMMIDRCRITRRPTVTDHQVDPDTGVPIVPDPVVIVADGPCLVHPPRDAERVVEVGGDPHTLRTLNVDLDPSIAANIEVRDDFEFIVSHNPHLLGRTWHVIDIADGTLSAARKLVIREELARGVDDG